jgi:hypothetical protein
LATQSGAQQYAGYHAVDLASTVPLAAGDAVYVVLHITGGGAYPMAVDGRYAGYNSDSTANPGESYYSYDGATWTDLTTQDATANACIKMLTGRPTGVPGESTVNLKASGKATGVNFGNHSLYLGLFDFGTTSSKVEGGFTRVSQKTTFTGTATFGWSSGTIKTADRGTGTYLNRDINYTTDGTFTVTAPDGTYKVSLLLGDQKSAHDDVSVAIEGSTLETDIDTLKGELVWKTYTVEVSDGQLNFRLRDAGGGTDPYAAIAAMKVLLSEASQSTPAAQSASLAALNGSSLESLAAAALSMPEQQASAGSLSTAAPAASVQGPAEQPSAVRLDVAATAFPINSVFKRVADQKGARGSTIATVSQSVAALQPYTLAWRDLADQAFATY